MIKLTETKNIYSFEIKKKKDILFNFSFSLTQDNKYKIIYNLYFDKVEKYFKNNETGIVAKGYLARILSHFYHEFKIKPDNEKQGFDFSLDIEFSGKIDENIFTSAKKLSEGIVQSPEETAIKIDTLINRIDEFQSGIYVDVRKI